MLFKTEQVQWIRGAQNVICTWCVKWNVDRCWWKSYQLQKNEISLTYRSTIFLLSCFIISENSMNLECVQVLNETTVFEFASLLPIINERKLLVIISEQNTAPNWAISWTKYRRRNVYFWMIWSAADIRASKSARWQRVGGNITADYLSI